MTGLDKAKAGARKAMQASLNDTLGVMSMRWPDRLREALDAYEGWMLAAGYHWECAKDANSKPLPQPPVSAAAIRHAAGEE